MKRIILSIITVILAGMLLLTVACSRSENNQKNAAKKIEFNKTGLPIVDKPVELEIVVNADALAPNYNDMKLVQKWENDTNVHIKWESVRGNDYEEKKNLILASGNIPDAFYNACFTDFDLLTYSKDGTLIPLEDLIDKYAPNIKALFKKRPELKKMVTAPDGHIYSIPGAEEMGLRNIRYFMAINKKWLDKLGLEIPETPDELYKVLKAFKTQDPNGDGKADEIPLSFINDHWCGDICELFTPFGTSDNIEIDGHITVIDGKVVFTVTQEGYKEGLSYLHKLYKEGLIDPESFTQNATQYLAKGKREPNILGMFVWWEVLEMVGLKRAEDYILLPPLKNKEGKREVGRPNTSSYVKAAFVITNRNKYPEVTMRWIDYIYEPKMAAQANWGPLDIIYKEDADGMLVNKELPEGTSMGELRQKVAPRGVGIILKEHFDTVVDMEPRAKKRLKDLKRVYEPYLKEEYFPKTGVFYTSDELEEQAIYEADILPYIKAQRAKWIVYGGVEKEWDNYIDVLNRMGIKKLLKIYQDAYDRYKKVK